MLSLFSVVDLFREHVWGITVMGEMIKKIPYAQIRTMKYNADNLRPTVEVIQSKFATCLDYSLAVEKLCGGQLYRVKNRSHIYTLVNNMFTDFGGTYVNIYPKEELLNMDIDLVEITIQTPKHRNDIFTKEE